MNSLNFEGVFSQDYYQLTVQNFRKDNLLNQPIDFEKIDLQRIHAAIFFVTNEQRVKHKLSVLDHSALLEKAAFMHAQDMVEKDFFSHENKFSRKKLTPNDRGKLVGISNPYIAENIAETFGLEYIPETQVYVKGAGQFSYSKNGNPIPPHTYLTFADALVLLWMNSPGHRKNILSEKALQLGCGVYYFKDKKFNEMPTFKAAQSFQWYEPVKTGIK
ncbi:MAG: CAP domain-containing protein [Bacteroidales bacterium]|nr:CAP domain-containing protein [Bacteroidales bacterium]